MKTYVGKRRAALKLQSIAAAALLLITAQQSTWPGSASAESVAADADDVSLVDPATAGRVDEAGRELEIEQTAGGAAEQIILARGTGGELTTTVVQSVPVDAPSTVSRETSDAALTTTTDAPGPVAETITPSLLSDTPDAWKPAFAYAVSETATTFAWYAASGEFDVWEGDVLVGTSADGIAVIDGLTAGSKHTFELEGVVDSADGGIPSSRTVPVILHDRDSETQRGVVAPMTYQQYTTAVSYRTFIQPASVDASMCNLGDTSYTFDGDGRSWDLPGIDEPFQAANYRTLMALNINWDNPSPYDMNSVKNVGQSVTRRYGGIVQATYASMDQMLFTEAYATSGYAQARFDHRASNPHCKLFDVNYGGSIQYNVMFRIYRSGTVEMVGWRKPVPNHEVYVRWNRTDGSEYWTSFALRGNSGFPCLLDGVCATDNYNLSISY